MLRFACCCYRPGPPWRARCSALRVWPARAPGVWLEVPTSAPSIQGGPPLPTLLGLCIQLEHRATPINAARVPACSSPLQATPPMRTLPGISRNSWWTSGATPSSGGCPSAHSTAGHPSHTLAWQPGVPLWHCLVGISALRCSGGSAPSHHCNPTPAAHAAAPACHLLTCTSSHSASPEHRSLASATLQHSPTAPLPAPIPPVPQVRLGPDPVRAGDGRVQRAHQGVRQRAAPGGGARGGRGGRRRRGRGAVMRLNLFCCLTGGLCAARGRLLAHPRAAGHPPPAPAFPLPLIPLRQNFLHAHTLTPHIFWLARGGGAAVHAAQRASRPAPTRETKRQQQQPCSDSAAGTMRPRGGFVPRPCCVSTFQFLFFLGRGQAASPRPACFCWLFTPCSATRWWRVGARRTCLFWSAASFPSARGGRPVCPTAARRRAVTPCNCTSPCAHPTLLCSVPCRLARRAWPFALVPAGVAFGPFSCIS